MLGNYVTFDDGSKHEGEYHYNLMANNKRLNGFGTKYNPDGSIKEQGIFVNGELITALSSNNVKEYLSNLISKALKEKRHTNSFNMQPCPSDQKESAHNCWGKFNMPGYGVYEGVFKKNAGNRIGNLIFEDGRKYVGHFLSYQFHGFGTLYNADGSIMEQGIYERGQLVQSTIQTKKIAKNNVSQDNTNIAQNNVNQENTNTSKNNVNANTKGLVFKGYHMEMSKYEIRDKMNSEFENCKTVAAYDYTDGIETKIPFGSHECRAESAYKKDPDHPYDKGPRYRIRYNARHNYLKIGCYYYKACNYSYQQMSKLISQRYSIKMYIKYSNLEIHGISILYQGVGPGGDVIYIGGDENHKYVVLDKASLGEALPDFDS